MTEWEQYMAEKLAKLPDFDKWYVTTTTWRFRWYEKKYRFNNQIGIRYGTRPQPWYRPLYRLGRWLCTVNK